MAKAHVMPTQERWYDLERMERGVYMRIIFIGEGLVLIVSEPMDDGWGKNCTDRVSRGINRPLSE